MGGLGRRVKSLEACSRRRASAAVKEAWDSLSDREIALEVVRLRKEVPLPAALEQKALAAQARLRSRITDGLLALAVAPKECGSEEELDARVRMLVTEAVYADGRRERISELVDDIEQQLERCRPGWEGGRP